MDKLERKLALGMYPAFQDSQGYNLHTVDGVRDYLTCRFLELDRRSWKRPIPVQYTRISDTKKLGNLFLRYANYVVEKWLSVAGRLNPARGTHASFFCSVGGKKNKTDVYL